jgi:hypothetical protein
MNTNFDEVLARPPADTWCTVTLRQPCSEFKEITNKDNTMIKKKYRN